jgi:ABC-type Fe3+-hydroxamate transport system substrate-binding protein
MAHGALRRLWTLASFALLIAAAWACLLGCERRAPAPSARADRIVSLAPAITETLFAIGAGDRVVGVSDYCDYPLAVKSLPRVGTSLTPSYEAIVRLGPTRVIGERAKGTPAHELSAVAPAVLLPWLSVADVTASTRELGKITGHEAAAEDLARRLSERLSRPPPPDAPRVLLVLGSDPRQLSDVWFIRRNSIHGAALEAAGGRNAVAEDIDGAPSLPLERVVTLNPDVVLILVMADTPNPEIEANHLASWRALPIAATKRGAVRVLWGRALQSNGPRILDVVDKLAAALREIPAARP